MKACLVYGPNVNLRLPGAGWLHPFDGRKYARAIKCLRRTFGKDLDTWIETPMAEATYEQLMSVYTPSYLESLNLSELIAKIVERGFLRRSTDGY